MSPTTAPGVFFVHDSSISMSTRDRELEQSEARSHAATVSYRRRATRDRVSGMRRAKYTECITVCQSRSTDPRKRNIDSRIDNGAVAVHGCSSCTAKRLSCNHQQPCTTKITHRSRHSLSPGFGCFREEQFAGIADSFNTGMRNIVDFQTQIIRPAYDVFTELFEIPNVHSFYVPMLVYPLFYHAGLALAGLVREHLDSTGRTLLEVLYHRGQALNLIRQHLDHPRWGRIKHEGLICSFLMLAYFEFLSGQPEIARQHLKALNRITNNGLDYLEGQALIDSLSEQRVISYHIDTFVMAGWVNSEENATPSWLPTYCSFPIDSQHRLLLDKVPAGFYNLVIEGSLCSRTLQLMARAVDVGIDSNDASKQQSRANRTRQNGTYSSISEACPILRISDNHNTQAILLDKMVCFALTLFCCSGTHTISFTFAFFRKAKAELNRRLRGGFEPRTNTERECLVWLFMVTINSCRPVRPIELMLTAEGMDLLCVFGTKFPEFVQRPWSDIERILSRFFWTTDLSRPWRRSWSDLTSTIETTRDGER